MKYRRLGRTGLEVSEIGLGALEIGRDWGIPIEGDFGRPDEKGAVELVHAALDLGINFYDTAPAYQLSEERLGVALRGRRQDVYIATKVGEHWSPERGFWYDYSRQAVLSSIDESLRRLETEYIDLLQIHSASIEIIERGEVLAAMRIAQDAGKVRFLGMTGDAAAAGAAINSGEYDTVQVPFSISNQEAAHSAFPAARERDVGVIVMIPLGHGALTAKFEHLPPDEQERVAALQFLVQPDQTLAQAALRFVLAHPAVSTAIPGTRKIANLRANAAAPDRDLSPDDMRRIAEVTAT